MREVISVIGYMSKSERSMNSCLVIVLVMLGATILMFSPFKANAIEDVPPAVPVDSVEVESLPLPEPIYAKPKSTQKQPTQKKKVQATKGNDEPNALERFWEKIVKASKIKSKKKQEENVWNIKKPSQKEPQAVAVSAAPPIKTEIIQDKHYLKNVLMPEMPEGGGFYVLELFTTQACPFCPKADAMMETYSALSHVIALSCHIDYFDVEEGSLSLPICSSRQKRYESFFKGTPKYTPQMVVNGRYDAVGYLSDKIALAFSYAHEHPVEPLIVRPDLSVEAGLPTYSVELPQQRAGRYQLWLIAYDRPLALTVKSGANAGKSLAYYNTVSKAQFFGSWDGQSRNVAIDVKLSENTKGFAFLVQDTDTGAIILAGKNE